MKNNLPSYNVDSAVIYRSLQELEKEGAVKSFWETDCSGPARKWYQITSGGYEKLAEYKEDIEQRVKNLNFFLEMYETNSKSNNQ